MSVPERLVGFVEALRDHSILAGPGETLDAARVLTVLGMDNREYVREGLAAALLRRSGQRTVFDQVFDLYFPVSVGGSEDGPRDVEELRDQLVEALASGTPVVARRGPNVLTPVPRYQRMGREFRALTGDLPVCGCHVHIGLPDDEARVLVSNHLRPWLPTLLAIGANSPYCESRDTGYASWRYLMWGRWPSAGPPPWFESAASYYAASEEVISTGAAMDVGMLYWDARLSAHHPTVELRVCDVAPTVDEAVLLAAISRGIATTALMAEKPAWAVPQHLLRPALWRAARDGLEGLGLDMRTRELVPAG
ncbi:YbdK family carboxylate-amine ligase, partial [Kibdelosporangium lantanae]